MGEVENGWAREADQEFETERETFLVWGIMSCAAAAAFSAAFLKFWESILMCC